MHSVGIIGIAGRMAQMIYDKLQHHPLYQVSGGFDQVSPIVGQLFPSMEEVFQLHDYVLDFSSPKLTSDLVQAALKWPKPVIIGTTGILEPEIIFESLAKVVPVVVAPNTSIGAYLQYRIALYLASFLSEDYDIDISEKHHRYKIDAPSGTSIRLAEGLVKVKNDKVLSFSEESKKETTSGKSTEPSSLLGSDLSEPYTWGVPTSPRFPRSISVTACRSGHLAGHHEVSFTSENETITIIHTSFNRQIFVNGVLTILDWLRTHCPQPGFYTLDDVFSTKVSYENIGD